MLKTDREEIRILARHSNLPADRINSLLHRDVYPGISTWKKFLKLFFLVLGVGFIAAGLIMFFAYNWDELPKFVKLGLMQFLVIASIACSIIVRNNNLVMNIALCFGSVMTGLLFTVFGQIYQTGADAFDLFVGWTFAIAIWVIVSNFAPLWLIFISLVSLTVFLYFEQVLVFWDTSILTLILASIYLVVFICAANVKLVRAWFMRVVALAFTATVTIGLCNVIFDDLTPFFWMLLLLTSASFISAISFALKSKQIYLLAIVPLSAVIIISAFLFSATSETGMFLIVFLFIVVAVTFIIRNLINLQKKWSVEQN